MNSAISPTVSMPEKPAPITVKVSACCLTSGSWVISACSSFSITCERSSRASSSVFSVIACSGRPVIIDRSLDWPSAITRVVVRDQRGPALHALEDGDFLALEVDIVDFRLAHEHVLEQQAQRRRRVRGGHLAGGDLGQQRLEDEIVLGVDQLDLGAVAEPAAQVARGEHAGEAAAQNHDAGFHGARCVGQINPLGR